MRAYVALLIASALLACSCVYILHPIVTPETAVFDPALIGTWSNPGGAESWEFTAIGGSQTYSLTYTSQEGAQGVFEVQLTDIAGTRFIQFMPDTDAADDCGFEGMNDFYRMHFPPMRTFAIVRPVDPGLTLAFPDIQWFDDYLEANPDAVPCEQDDLLFLTGSTEQLRAFLGAVASEDGAFSDSDPLYKDGMMPPPTPEMMH